jgi:hypothetical protein
VHSTIEYWVKVRLLRIPLSTYIELHDSLICVLNHQVLSQGSATPIIPVLRYWIECQPNRHTRAFSIGSMFGPSDYFVHQYWIGFQVGLTYSLEHLVLNQCSATLIISFYQYWITFQADLCTQWSSIESIFCHSDHSGTSILTPISAWSVHSTIE